MKMRDVSVIIISGKIEEGHQQRGCHSSNTQNVLSLLCNDGATSVVFNFFSFSWWWWASRSSSELLLYFLSVVILVGISVFTLFRERLDFKNTLLLPRPRLTTLRGISLSWFASTSFLTIKLLFLYTISLQNPFTVQRRWGNNLSASIVKTFPWCVVVTLIQLENRLVFLQSENVGSECLLLASKTQGFL